VLIGGKASSAIAGFPPKNPDRHSMPIHRGNYERHFGFIGYAGIHPENDRLSPPHATRGSHRKFAAATTRSEENQRPIVGGANGTLAEAVRSIIELSPETVGASGMDEPVPAV
jgi:hypothetical protein